MIKRLWIDDLRVPPTYQYVIARTYDEAIEWLELVHFDEVYLDHDLADFKNNKERTGYDVCLFMAERASNNLFVPKSYHMLTANPVGKARMLRLIARYLM